MSSAVLFHAHPHPSRANGATYLVMASAQGQRIQASCEIIWGTGDYDIDIETDDWISYIWGRTETWIM